MSSDRQTGRTTRQMQESPRGAVFVWCNGHLAYPRDLARRLGRTDLEIVSPGWLDERNMRGREFTAIVLDHATELTSLQWYALSMARGRTLLTPPSNH